MKLAALVVLLVTVSPIIASAQEHSAEVRGGSASIVLSQAGVLFEPPLGLGGVLLAARAAEARPLWYRPARAQCPGRPSRTAKGFLLGVLLGGSLGYVHGSAGHPGLPHTGLDVPDQWEYTPLFALAGGIVGGVVAASTARCA